MYEIRNVPLGLIDPNPHRDLGNYPWMEEKIAQLIRSMEDVGFWAGVIARRKGKRFETAFGHHRIEAARRREMKDVPLIIDDLSDQRMLQYMGRENGEDYSADYLVMLNTWEGAVKFLANSTTYGKPAAKAAKTHQPLEIAGVLGWVDHRKDGRHMTDIARSCWAGHALITGGHMARRDMIDISMREARELVTRTYDRVEGLARVGAREGHLRADTKRAQATVGKAAKITARSIRDGDVARRDIRNEVDLNTLRAAGKEGVAVQAPLFAVFGQALCEQIGRMLAKDSAAERINEIGKAMDAIEQEEDRAIIRKLHHELDELAIRAGRSKTRTTLDKVVRLKAVEQKGA